LLFIVLLLSLSLIALVSYCVFYRRPWFVIQLFGYPAARVE